MVFFTYDTLVLQIRVQKMNNHSIVAGMIDQ
jgi:hypothetical protein